MVGKTKPWTKRERSRLDDVLRSMPYCIRCFLSPGNNRRPYTDIHHLIQGNRRMGHYYTLPLCLNCHQAAHAAGGYPFEDQLRHWYHIQHTLGLSDELPGSKIVPRRVA